MLFSLLLPYICLSTSSIGEEQILSLLTDLPINSEAYSALSQLTELLGLSDADNRAPSATYIPCFGENDCGAFSECIGLGKSTNGHCHCIYGYTGNGIDCQPFNTIGINDEFNFSKVDFISNPVDATSRPEGLTTFSIGLPEKETSEKQEQVPTAIVFYKQNHLLHLILNTTYVGNFKNFPIQINSFKVSQINNYNYLIVAEGLNKLLVVAVVNILTLSTTVGPIRLSSQHVSTFSNILQIGKSAYALSYCLAGDDKHSPICSQVTINIEETTNGKITNLGFNTVDTGCHQEYKDQPVKEILIIQNTPKITSTLFLYETGVVEYSISQFTQNMNDVILLNSCAKLSIKQSILVGGVNCLNSPQIMLNYRLKPDEYHLKLIDVKLAIQNEDDIPVLSPALNQELSINSVMESEAIKIQHCFKVHNILTFTPFVKKDYLSLSQLNDQQSIRNSIILSNRQAHLISNARKKMTNDDNASTVDELIRRDSIGGSGDTGNFYKKLIGDRGIVDFTILPSIYYEQILNYYAVLEDGRIIKFNTLLYYT